MSAFPELERTVYEALGQASMCWEDPGGAGVFDSDRCAAIGEKLVAYLAELGSLAGLQSAVGEWHQARWYVCPLPVLAAKLAEECGEVASEIVSRWEEIADTRPDSLSRFAKRLALELADVVIVALAIADRAGIDLQAAVEAKALYIGALKEVPA